MNQHESMELRLSPGRLRLVAAAAAVVLVMGAAGLQRVSAQDGGSLVFANWPEYSDIDEETGAYPTLDKFEAETGIDVTYLPLIHI